MKGLWKFFRRFVDTEFVKTCDELVRNWLIKVDTFMIIRGMEHIQAWTIRKEFESNLDVSDSLNDENIDKYKCHKYLQWKKRVKNYIYIHIIPPIQNCFVQKELRNIRAYPLCFLKIPKHSPALSPNKRYVNCKNSTHIAVSRDNRKGRARMYH